MAEWGVPWHVYERDWTELQFQLMLRMAMERKRKEQQAARRGGKQRVPYE